jgi:hypothetical protein
LDPNMGGEAAPVKSPIWERGRQEFDFISVKLRNTA